MRGVSIPLLDATFASNVYGYYWTMRQSEYATDVMISRCGKLARRSIPILVNHAIQGLTCEDVLRFLGRRTDRRFLRRSNQ